jgi:hypothetical protein
MAEADRDLEALLNGEDIEINDNANNAYKQKMVNYLREHKEDINMKQFELISLYIKALEPTIFRNEARSFQNEITDNLNKPLSVDENGMSIEQPIEQPGGMQSYDV